MVHSVMFGVLGPVEAWVDGHYVDMGGPHTRATLATLVLERPRVVSVEHLVDAVWGEAPPASARTQVQNRISTLRRLFGSAGIAGDIIETRGSGYVLRADSGQCDFEVFERQVSEAEAFLSQGVTDSAVSHLSRALSLWRGSALDGFSTPRLSAVAKRLNERRMNVELRRIDVQIDVGKLDDAVGRLFELVSEHPWHERLVARLMVALYQENRQREALECYERLRRGLADELGLDPSPELRELHGRILRAEWGRPAAIPAPVDRRGALVPRQLPRAVPSFVGREDQLRQLDELFTGEPAHEATVVITGTAGVGKTALALRWAHQAAGRFSDGQLYVNMRGFDPGGTPLSTAEAIRGFLDVLEVPAWRVPKGLEAQVGLYRTLLADRRILVMVDNARDAEQVRPLLPGSATCAVVVTSRNTLSSLATMEGARILTVDLMSDDESCQLLVGRIGDARAVAEPRHLREMTTLCARLPLALAVAGAWATTHPEVSLDSLVRQLRDAGTALDALEGSPVDDSLRAVFSWSYRALTPDTARLFRFLGLHPGPDFDEVAAASLISVTPERARSALAELSRASLLLETGPGRFSLHDLLWAYATESVVHLDDAGAREAAVRRMLDHYSESAYEAALRFNPHRHPISPVRGAARAPGGIADRESAARWFAAEHQVLSAVAVRAARLRHDTHAWRTVWALADFLDRSGKWYALMAAGETALDSADRSLEPAGRAHAHSVAGRAYARLGRYEQALEHLASALKLFAEQGDDRNQAYIHRGLGAILEWRGETPQALHHDQLALDLYQRVGDRPGEASALNSVGWCHSQLGDHERALDSCQRALELHREMGNRHGEASALDSLGYAHHQKGDHWRAVEHYDAALVLFRGLGDRYYGADTLAHRGDALAAVRDNRGAREAWRASLAILDDLDHPDADRVRRKLAA